MGGEKGDEGVVGVDGDVGVVAVYEEVAEVDECGDWRGEGSRGSFGRDCGEIWGVLGEIRG